MPKALPKVQPIKAPKLQQHENRRFYWKGYHGTRWRKARKGYLQKHPECVKCKEQGRSVPAVVVDHIDPIDEAGLVDPWNTDNWQGLCRSHDAQKRGATGH